MIHLHLKSPTNIPPGCPIHAQDRAQNKNKEWSILKKNWRIT